jgi:hypothetical protein
MIKSFVKLFVGRFFVALLVALAVYSKSFASPRADDSWQQTRILYDNIKSFFGDLRGTFRFDNEKLSLQISDGLEYDQLTAIPAVHLPPVGNGLYLVSGSTAHDFPLFSAVIITPSEKVVSAAMLDTAGLTIFLRPSKGNSHYVAVFNKWAQNLWCSGSPVYVGLGYTGKLDQKFDPSNCRLLKIKTIYLSGYGNISVN